jgi:undecaprenyl-diphosphatase
LLLVTSVLALLIRIEPNSGIEAIALSQVQSTGATGTEKFMAFVSFVTGTSTRYVIIPLALSVMWFAGLRRASRHLLIGSIAIGIVAMIGDYGLGLIADRVRPFSGATELSFPSAHTYGTVLFFGIVAFVILRHGLPRKFSFPTLGILAIFTLFVGPSRIYLNMHWPADVVAGYIYGVAALLLFVVMYTHLERRAAQPITLYVTQKEK